MSNYDYSHIKELDPNDLSKVDGLILRFAKWVLIKGYGGDVRKGLGWAIERFGVLLNEYKADANLTKHQMEVLSNEINNTISGLTQDAEVKNARVSIDGVIFNTLKQRLDSIEENAGDTSTVVGEVDLDGGSLYIEGLDSPNSPITFDVEKTVDEEEIPFGIETIDVNDIGFEPYGGNDNV